MSDRNRTTVRRALRAGLVMGVAAALLLALVGAPGATAFAGAIAMAALGAAAWLLLSALLDVLAGEPPDRRRTLWTIGATLIAMLGPFLVIGTLAQGAGR